MNVKYNRKDILIKGIQLIQQRGYGNTGIQDILKACDIPKGSFYNFFSSKEAFALEAIELYKDYTLGLLEKADKNEELSPSKKIKAFFMKSNEIFISMGGHQNCMLLSLSTEVTHENNTFSKPIIDSFRVFKTYLVKWITKAQEEGEMRKDMSANDVVNLLYDGYHGAVLRMKYNQNPTPLHEFVNNTLRILMV
ncbi:TetR/AcrR family transcriptional regulator [Spongiimicrobium salis]|uniref:TetR/AcrR family transcriptional regulator n=1 Tax=Spongiimicrobium salis TaxID=1667022 RepID=UPI00374D7FD7